MKLQHATGMSSNDMPEKQKTKKNYLHHLLPFRFLFICFSLFSAAFSSYAQNSIVTENAIAGTAPSVWDISGAGDLSIQGFATDISVNKGQTVHFKIDVTDASQFNIKIYRIGYYQGNGARLIASLGPFTGTNQPEPISDQTTGLVDCGNWSESASWAVPQTSVSGLYIAKLTKTAAGGGSSHIMFIVRDDQSTSDLFFQTSDATWQAYNVYGGNSLYVGAAPFANGHAAKVSYNRPFITRNGGGGGGVAQDGPFNAEYPMIRWLEKNGYNISYTTDIDAARNGSLMLNHKVYMSVGHDEYWSAEQRANVEAARNAGVNIAFFSGNEVYWKTRWENSVDGSNTQYRTLVCYKEGTLGENVCGNKCDPLPNTWTGLWRDGCSSPNADGCKPENALSGQISWDQQEVALTVPDTYKKLRFWRNTSIASLPAGQSATLTAGTIGYEYSFEQPAYASKNPPGRILLSSTIVNGHNHKLSLYRHSSGALVFGAGTVQWSWGLDGTHDRGSAPPSLDMQQATLNLLADMGAQPGVSPLPGGLVAATASTDHTPPASVITNPSNGASLPTGSAVTITGTASDVGGVVAGVEVSTDGGTTWNVATGSNSWSYIWTPNVSGNITIKSRSFDDIGNIEATGGESANTVTVTVVQAQVVCPCSVFKPTDVPATPVSNDQQGIETGFRFRASTDGYITGIRYYKGASTTGTRIGNLWSNTGDLLNGVSFTGESASGWQQVMFPNAIAITAGTTYVASVFSPSGDYASTNPFFDAAIANGPLTALANGTDGANGVYKYSATSTFPTDNFQSSNYWVDVVFNTTAGPDVTPPVVVSSLPAGGTSGINVNNHINITFNEDISAATVSTSTVLFKTSAGTTVPSTIAYSSANRTVTITPSGALNYSQTYTVTLKGGTTEPRIKDISANALANDYTFNFTTSAPPPPPPTDGPGGPILIISSTANPFSRYAVEILRAEGLNEFAAMDISAVTPAILNNYDVVILGEITITAANVTMLTDWTTAGGTLIAFKPSSQLASLFGITPAGSTLSNQYLLVNTASGPGKGIVSSTMQFHGTADLYTLSSATSLATLYSNATTATNNPAVTTRSVGANGGKAIAFTYDLAKSVIYTRQGNPAWAGQPRDGQSGPIRADNLFFGNAAGDAQPDWVDFTKIAIPQADEQQRLLVNIILQDNLHRKPLPRFWFLPKGLKAAVVMTGDDHGNNGTTGRFTHYEARSTDNSPQAVANWTAIRGTSYMYPSTGITSADLVKFQNDGFEIALHLSTDCADFTASSLSDDWDTQWASLSSKFPAIIPATTNRTHCIPWSDWITHAKVEASKGVRLDANYYYWPGAWIQDRPGMFTGSGMPMRFADVDGTIIDNYQVVTQLTDESEITIPTHINTLLDNAVGTTGYYGVFCANMHNDATVSDGSEAIIDAAIARNIPVISSKQMLTWLDGRNSSSFGAVSWTANKLSFTIAVGSGALNLKAMLPIKGVSGVLTSLTFNGSSVAFTTQTIKGLDYGFFDASAGNYVATYSADNTAPLITSVTATPHADGTATITWTTNEASDSKVDYGTTATSLTLHADSTKLVTSHSVVLSNLTGGTTYYYQVTSADASSNSTTSPVSGSAALSFIELSAPCIDDNSVADFTLGTKDANVTVIEDGDGAIILTPILNEEFSANSVPASFTAENFQSDGTATVANGSVTVSGAHLYSNNSFSVGSSVEFMATFNSATFQNIGFSADQPFNNAPWVTIGQGASADGNVYARASDGSSVSLGAFLGSPHVYRIQWNATNFEFYVDGSATPAFTINLAVATNLFLQISDVVSSDGALSADWIRVTPYASTGTYTSRVFDAGAVKNWGGVNWVSTNPAGTNIAFTARTGNTATPDGSWTNYIPIASSGDVVGSESRYIQYKAVLSTTNTNVTPELQEVAINCSASNTAPVLAAIGAKSGTTGQVVTFTATASDADAGQTLAFSLASGAPQGASIDAASGVFTWTPAQAGSYQLTVVVSDNGSPVKTDQQQVTITVSAPVNNPPTLSPIGNPTTTTGQAVTFTASASDVDAGQVLTFSLVNAPQGATINSTSGAFSWTPAQAGSYQLTVVVSDNGSPVKTDQEVITITVSAPVNNPPTLNAIGNKTGTTGQAVTFTASATDVDAGQVLTFSVVNAPQGATINSTSGTFSWTPAQAGSYQLTVIVSDNGSPVKTDQEPITITVTDLPPSNVAPVLAAIGKKTATSGVKLSFTASATDANAGQILAFSLLNAPTGASINSTTGAFSWTPSQAGTFTFTVKVTDNGTPALSDQETITVTVTSTPPISGILEAELAVLNKAVVASNQPGFTGTGFADYINTTGDYVEWTLNKTVKGSVTLTFRYSNGATVSRPLKLEVNGVVVAASLAFPPTGGWAKWATVKATANVIAGANKIRLTAIGSSGGNLDNLAWKDTTLAPVSGTLEAELAVLNKAVVASNQTGFTGTGFADYVNASGDYVEWTLNKTSAGFVSLGFRYANGATVNRPLKLEINGVVVAANLAFPPTGGWAKWSISKYIGNLISGANKIRLTAIGSSGGNLDHLEWRDTTVKSGILEAELAVLNKVVVSSKSPGYTGTGYADYVNNTGDYIEWTVNKTGAGPASLNFRYANGGTVSRPLKLEVNGVVVVASLAFVPTGGWANWSTSVVTTALNSGANKVRLTAIGSSGANVDNLTWNEAAGVNTIAVAPTEIITSISNADAENITVYAMPNPSMNTFNISINSNNRKDKISLIITDILGRTMEIKNNIPPGDKIEIGSSYRPGVYIVRIKQGEYYKSIKLIKERN